VFDKTTGDLLTRYIVIPVGGANLPAELIALSLP
jgi:hypothetical protein